MKKPILLGALAVIVVGLVILTATNPEWYQGRLTRRASVKASTCNSTQWTKVFETEYQSTQITQVNQESWYLLAPTLPIKHSDLQKLVNNGCDFKMVRNSSSGGGSGPHSYECALVTAYKLDQVGKFHCSSGNVSNNSYTPETILTFSNGKFYYVEEDNAVSLGGASSFSIFTRK